MPTHLSRHVRQRDPGVVAIWVVPPVDLGQLRLTIHRDGTAVLLLVRTRSGRAIHLRVELY